MLKRAIVLLLLLSMVVTLFGCGKKKPDEPPIIVDDPPNSWHYGFGEDIQFVTYDKYLKFESFEICESYGNLEPSENGSGYYVILGVSTNLTESDFANDSRISTALSIDRNEALFLKVALFDAENAKLVLEIPQVNDADYAKLMTLKIKDQPLEYANPPSISFKISPYYLEYVTIEGEEYFGKKFEGQLEWGS